METKKIITPAGHELVIKTSLNARERNGLRNILLKNTKMSFGADGKQQDNGMVLDGTILEETEKKLIEVIVVQYKEITSTDAILNTLLEGTPDEYDFVVSEVGKINENLTTAK